MYLTKDSEVLKGQSEQALKNLLGGKGAGLYWMTSQGLNVPPFVVYSTEVCRAYNENPSTTMQAIEDSLDHLIDYFIHEFGYMPLLSVRSGARVSMPGMMDTILNVGLQPDFLPDWNAKLGEACVDDSFHRLITMYGSVVKGLDRHELEAKQGWIGAADYYQRKAGEQFPARREQILGAIEAVFKSWNNERAIYYRKMNNIPDTWGTAVTVQAMVFGNLNDNSCTGVMFTRNPDSGDPAVLGEYLVNAQGEDVVAGIRTPLPLAEMTKWNAQVAGDVLQVASKLEAAKREVQDVEFTVQDGKLYVLQTRDAKRSARAAVKIALDFHKEGVIDRKTALKRVSLRILEQANNPTLDPKFKTEPAFKGIPACSGVVTGVVCRTSADAVAQAKGGKKVLLVTQETTPDDIAGMHAAVGILTMTGGSTSHAAVVARSMNRACVVGLGKDLDNFPAGSVLSICGSTGRVWKGEVPLIAGASEDVARLHALLMEGKVEIGTTVPAINCAEYVLDLSHTLMLGMPQVQELVAACAAKVQTLYISFLCEKDPILSAYYRQVLPEAKIKDRMKFVLGACVRAEIKHKVVGLHTHVTGASKVLHTVDPDIMELASMTDLKQGDTILLSSPIDTLQTNKKKVAAMSNLIRWLKADGVSISSINVPTEGKDFIARSLVAKELLG